MLMRIAIAETVCLLLLACSTGVQAEPFEAGAGSDGFATTLADQKSSEVDYLAESELSTDVPVLPGDVHLTKVHDYLSRNVEILSRKIDAFFGAERAFDESSGTYVQARGSIIFQNSGGVDFDGQLRAKLDMPNLERKLSLVIESEPEELVQQGGRITTGSRTLTESIDSKDIATSLQYVLREQPTWDVRLQPGVRLRWPPRTFLRLRSRHLRPISEVWLSRTTFTPGWFDPRGFEVRLRHDFDRDAGNASLFRVASEAIWLVNEDRNVHLVQSFAYSHPLGERVRMAYEVGASFETSPTFWDTSYFSSIRYRRNIHRDWLFFELKPQVLFERENNFKTDLSLALTLEVVFGAQYLSDNQL